MAEQKLQCHGYQLVCMCNIHNYYILCLHTAHLSVLILWHKFPIGKNWQICRVSIN